MKYNMKVRTLNDIHDREIGHTKFAKFVDYAIENGYAITDIKEYQTKYKFNWNGYPLEFDKDPNISVWWQYGRCEKLYKMYIELNNYIAEDLSK